MRFLQALFILAFVAAACLPLFAGGCIETSSEFVTAGDLASTLPELRQLEPSTPLFATPNAGVTRTLDARDLQQLAQSHQITLTTQPVICIEREAIPLQASVVQAALDAAIHTRSRNNTPVRYSILRYEPATVPPGTLSLSTSGPAPAPIAGGRNVYVWAGAYAYGDRRSLPFRIWLDISSTSKCLATTRAIDAGQEIAERDTTLIDVADGLRATSCIEDAASLRGAVARRAIEPGKPLLREHIRIRPLVQRGDAVSVVARSGGAQITTGATALTNGARGDTIYVQFAGNRTPIKARVVGQGRAEINAGGLND